jgi:bifunctional non-homologous end joining protein LigD
MLTDLAPQLAPLRRASSLFGTTVPAQHAGDAHCVESRLAGEVAFTERTTGMIMRHPSWRGLRTGKNADQAHRET